MRKIVLTGMVLFSALSMADEFKLEEVPPLQPIKLLVSRLNQNHHLLLAREKSGGNYYLIINDDRRTYVPKLKPSSMIYYDGGSADLYLESGERVLIPANRIDNYLKTSLGPSIIYANQAPIPLRGVTISDAKLERLGFSQFISTSSDDQKQKARRDEWEDYRPLKDLQTKVVVRVQLKAGIDYDLRRQIEKNLKELDDDKVRFLERGNQVLFGRSSINLLAAPDVLVQIRDQFPGDVVVSFGIFDTKQIEALSSNLPPGDWLEHVKVLGDEATPLQIRAASMNAIHHSAEHLSALTEEDKIQLIKGLLDTLGDLDQIHARLHNFAMHETAVKDFKSGKNGWEYGVGSFNNISQTESHPIRLLMLDSIRQLGKQGYEILDKVDHPIARQIVVETSDALNGSGIPLLHGQPTGINHLYFREWLDQLRVGFALVDKLPFPADYKALGDLELSMSSHSGGIFENIGVSGDMTSLISHASRAIYFTNKDATERLPTILFGLPGDKENLKRELIQYIIEADKKAQKLSAWEKEARLRRSGSSENNSFNVAGDDNLFKLIVGLIYVPRIARIAVPNFSEAEYTRTVIEVFQQLLEIASVSLENTGTYVSVLEASLAVIKNVESQYGLNSRKQARLSAAAVQLQRIVHNKMNSGLTWMSRESSNANACAIFLSPDPWQAFRGNR